MAAPLAPGNPLYTSPSANLNPDQDALRWRGVIDRITELERLVKQSVKYNTPTPAGQEIVLPTIRGTNFNVSDGVRNRVQIGNLPAYTDPGGVVSAAQYGGRVLDANGNVLWDALGISESAKKIAEVININAVQGTNTAFGDVTGAVTPSFTLTRQTNLWTIAMGRISCQGAGALAFFGLRTGGVTTTGAPNEVDQSVNGTVPMSMFMFTTLPAGTYTAAVQANVQPGGGVTWNLEYVDLAVIQMGG